MNKRVYFISVFIIFIALFISCTPKSASNSSEINSDNNIVQDKTEIFELESSTHNENTKPLPETVPENNVVQTQTETIVRETIVQETVISKEAAKPASQVVPIHSKPVISFENRKDSWNKTSYDLMSNEGKRRRYTTLITEEMNKYPKEYFNRINLDTIVIAENLKYDNVYRAAVPDYGSRTLFIGIRSDYSDDYVREVYHHEQHHYAEYSIWKSYRYDWAPWRDLFNGVGGGGEQAYQGGEDKTAAVYRHGLTGFLNTYSTYGQEEDRAEMVSYFLTDHNNWLFIDKAKKDEIFYEKVILLLTLFKEELHFDLLKIFYSKMKE